MMHTIFRERIDDVLSVYRSAKFERVALARGYSPRAWLAFALVTATIAMVLLAGALGFFIVAAKQGYLAAYGLEAPGRTLTTAYHGGTYGPKTRWETITYEFTTPRGETIKGKLDRPVAELSGLAGGDRFMIAYWERFPSVNAPRGVQANVGAIILTPLFLLFGLHFALWSRRMFGWRRSLVQSKATKPNLSAQPRSGIER